ncbi:MAG TPA: ribonuclease III [Rhizomicrobium sp.]|nr:ribonuclease III [Rhizomicrobium sp.]
MIEPKDTLSSRLGHAFHDKSLLARALTHASADTVRSNERLEFLGDRVLGLVVADKLHRLYPDDPEGVLALKLNALVRREACAAAAERAGLADHVVLAASEAASGGRRKSAILAGVCEAVIAALYVDGGYDVARAFIERYWDEAFAKLGADMRDAKTALQEWAQARRDAPVYKLVGREGPDHAPRFVVEVTIKSEGSATGEGNSKREAEQAAARTLLARVDRPQP